MGHRHRMDDASSVSSYSSGGSSRSSSRSSSSSGSSKKSRSSEVSHSNIRSDHWAVSLLKYTAGAPFGKPMSLRKTKVREYQEDWDDDDAASIYSDVSYTTYAWVKPKWDDSISEIASRSSRRSNGRRGRGQNDYGRPRFTMPPPPHQQPPPFGHPPPPPQFMAPPGAPMYDENPGFVDMNAGYHHPPPPPPPPPPAFGSGGAPAFFDLNGGGGGGGGGGPGKYDDWA
ncbi:hypothetical protein CH063_06507 [Colletotrichum higginsianum]|uniref:Uncharacterized protein n=2 Tax=Colletotrichum higginsianum TaxID=80884 RepID=H1V2S3_COLHI|nr:hypothetical protein CH63R_14150 [Colletotrichum higginsianum IMI 349063]OBR02924.1 hypothetical protein CH63R_14150 [Colletotrichum higginsianum IMI 349063]TID07689.1 hypothetical protein CH35J_000603 [Colletotrichum higginsianum]CCF34525.1 hypothetical protein CH063_06507 [Colletotrichum higginsianum]